MTKALIQNLDICKPGELMDEYLAMAHTIEQSLIAAGGIPGKDYTLLDLYKLAQPFALDVFRDESKRLGYWFPGPTQQP